MPRGQDRQRAIGVLGRDNGDHADAHVERLLHLDAVDAAALGDHAEHRCGRPRPAIDLGPIALALLKRGLPADTALTTGGEAQVAAVIDADSMPSADVTGAGRLAVDRLRGGAR